MIEFFLAGIALVWIIFAVVTDFKKNEVPDWLNYSLIIFALGFRFFYSLFSSDMNFDIFWQGLIGLGIFFVLGNVLYMLRMFAGGDAKLMIALGAVLPFFESFQANLNVFLVFFALFLLAGALYGLFTVLYFTIRDFRKFSKKFSKKFMEQKTFFCFILFFALVLIGFNFIDMSFLYFGILMIILVYFYISAKVIDEGFMVKKVKTKDLTPGDWLYEDVRLSKNKKIKSNWEGLNKKDIKSLEKKKKYVKVKRGIPFTPAFLMSFIVLLFILFKDYVYLLKMLF